jgi:hypothetical protein
MIHTPGVCYDYLCQAGASLKARDNVEEKWVREGESNVSIFREIHIEKSFLIVPRPRERAKAPSKMSLTTIHNPEIRSQVLRITSLTCSGPAPPANQRAQNEHKPPSSSCSYRSLDPPKSKPYHHLRYPSSPSLLCPLSLAFSFSSPIALRAALVVSLCRTPTCLLVDVATFDFFVFYPDRLDRARSSGVSPAFVACLFEAWFRFGRVAQFRQQR